MDNLDSPANLLFLIRLGVITGLPTERNHSREVLMDKLSVGSLSRDLGKPV